MDRLCSSLGPVLLLATLLARPGGSRKVAVDGLLERPPVRTDFGIVLENDKRELVQIIPTMGWKVGPGTIEAGARLPVHGRRFPAGPTVTLGYFLTWDTPLWR